MRVHELTISHFRGIAELTWRPRPGLTCFVGPGDSTKTTILDTLSLVLAASWNIQFDDADFTDGDVDHDIVVTVTLTDLSDDLISLDAFGTMLRGVAPDGTIYDDPIDGAKPAITIELRVDASLEPVWSVLKESADDPRRVHGRLRELLACLRVDDGVDRHLRWSRGSALSAITGETPELALLLANAHRAARKAIFDNPDPDLADAAERATARANATAGVTVGDLRPGLDPAVYSRAGALNLHEGDLPVDSYGLGTRRLIGLALQLGRDDAIILVDEVEAGLDPHRLAQFIQRLRDAADDGRQVIVVTHSPLVVQRLGIDHLAIVRSTDQVTTVTYAPHELAEERMSAQGLVRAAPSALLAPKVIVCEGATEVGFVAGYLRTVAGGAHAGSLGAVAVVDGAGDTAPTRARHLALLGYPTALVVDADDPAIDDDVAVALEAGVQLIRCSDGLCLETQVTADMAESDLARFLALAITIRSEDTEPVTATASCRDAVAARISGTPNLSGDDPTAWCSDEVSLDEVRSALGRAAGDKKWFKRQEYGQQLGALLAACERPAGTTGINLDKLIAFVSPDAG